MEQSKLGTLYGIGVGPGDPDLLTIKAARLLGIVDIVFTASSSSNEHSLARQIASPHLKAEVELKDLSFPMTEDENALNTAWKNNAEIIASELKKGRTAAFLTLGDCLTYSTFAYLLPYLAKILPNAPIVSVPGITSYQLAAALLNRPLVMTKESLSILSGGGHEENFETILNTSDNVVIMKSYRARDKIVEKLKNKNLAHKTALCSQLALPDQKITDGLTEEITDKPNYFSLMLINKREKK